MVQTRLGCLALSAVWLTLSFCHLQFVAGLGLYRLAYAVPPRQSHKTMACFYLPLLTRWTTAWCCRSWMMTGSSEAQGDSGHGCFRRDAGGANSCGGG
ncbi:hypothetical protein HDK90DRAFT_271026 [Phyllosticta capitalensis]|uniref:Secreted protein n=1 Tax=Phyllosticta capitalensis TaxID=121624 RepID=A0ABR1YM40_9PEZI